MPARVQDLTTPNLEEVCSTAAIHLATPATLPATRPYQRPVPLPYFQRCPQETLYDLKTDTLQI